MLSPGDHIIKDVYARTVINGIIGFIIVSLGVGGIKMYYYRHKDNFWGRLYRINLELNNIYSREDWERSGMARILVCLGVGAIIIGLYTIFFEVF